MLFLLSLINFSVKTTTFGIHFIDSQEEIACLWQIQWEKGW